VHVPGYEENLETGDLQSDGGLLSASQIAKSLVKDRHHTLSSDIGDNQNILSAALETSIGDKVDTTIKI
jgi:hypothetical protein